MEVGLQGDGFLAADQRHLAGERASRPTRNVTPKTEPERIRVNSVTFA
jgi:hypothetical protein